MILIEENAREGAHLGRHGLDAFQVGRGLASGANLLEAGQIVIGLAGPEVAIPIDAVLDITRMAKACIHQDVRGGAYDGAIAPRHLCEVGCDKACPEGGLYFRRREPHRLRQEQLAHPRPPHLPFWIAAGSNVALALIAGLVID